jgi:hypothetical protein
MLALVGSKTVGGSDRIWRRAKGALRQETVEDFLCSTLSPLRPNLTAGLYGSKRTNYVHPIIQLIIHYKCAEG